MAQEGSGILLGCCANSQSVHGRIQFEFPSVNTNKVFVFYFFLLLELLQSEFALSFTAPILRLPESRLGRCTSLGVQTLTRTLPKQSFVQMEPG